MIIFRFDFRCVCRPHIHSVGPFRQQFDANSTQARGIRRKFDASSCDSTQIRRKLGKFDTNSTQAQAGLSCKSLHKSSCKVGRSGCHRAIPKMSTATRHCHHRLLHSSDANLSSIGCACICGGKQTGTQLCVMRFGFSDRDCVPRLRRSVTLLGLIVAIFGISARRSTQEH